MKFEKWLPIPGFEESYLISSFGNIYSLLRNIELKIKPNKRGYVTVGLMRNGKQINNKVHRLVMLAFKGKSHLEVNHKDGNKSNNKLNNLEYCTPSENVQHSHDTGLSPKLLGEKCNNSKLKAKQIIEIKKLLKNKVKQRDIAKKFNVVPSTINFIKSGKTWRHII